MRVVKDFGIGHDGHLYLQYTVTDRGSSPDLSVRAVVADGGGPGKYPPAVYVIRDMQRQITRAIGEELFGESL